MAFLNDEGLQYIWDKIVDALKGKANKVHQHNIDMVIAEVGQTIIAKEVDENGRVIRWESINIEDKIRTELESLKAELTEVKSYLNV